MWYRLGSGWKRKHLPDLANQLAPQMRELTSWLMLYSQPGNRKATLCDLRVEDSSGLDVRASLLIPHMVFWPLFGLHGECFSEEPLSLSNLAPVEVPTYLSLFWTCDAQTIFHSILL